jgi:dolichol-phosphate mannosyltransferase
MMAKTRRFYPSFRMLTSKKLSIIPICYKDEANIREMVRQIHEAMKNVTPNYEIVYVNDCSPDGSLAILRELAAADPRIMVVSHSRNFGSHMAFSSGLAHCTGDAAVMLDGDLQDPPSLIPAFVEKWLAGYDVAYGVRTSREEGWLIHTCRRLFYRLWQKMSYIKIPVDAGDFSLVDRKVIDALNAMPERDRFLRGMRAWVGFKQVGVPYHRLPRFDGRKPTSSLSGYLWYAKSGILSFSRAPLDMLTYGGVLLTCLSFLAIIVYFVAWLILPPSSSPPGLLTLYILILFSTGIQLLSMSIIGEYIGKIFDEVKARPRFIVDEIINDHRNS